MEYMIAVYYFNIFVMILIIIYIYQTTIDSSKFRKYSHEPNGYSTET